MKIRELEKKLDDILMLFAKRRKAYKCKMNAETAKTFRMQKFEIPETNRKFHKANR